MAENKEKTDPEEKDWEKNPNFKEAREHFRAARKAMRHSMGAWIPEGFRKNRLEARKEFLMGIRKMVDGAIEHIDQVQKED